MAGKLATIDYVILAVYLLGTVALGLAIGRRIKTGKDFFLAGKTLPWWAIGMSLVATDIGGTDIIGVGGAAYSHGLAVANFEWIGCVPAMIVGAFIFIPIFWRLGIYTIPEYMEKQSAQSGGEELGHERREGFVAIAEVGKLRQRNQAGHGHDDRNDVLQERAPDIGGLGGELTLCTE